MVDVAKIRTLQAGIRREAQRGSVEEALNALAAVAAEAIVTVPGDARVELLGVFGVMVQDCIRQAEALSNPYGAGPLPGLGGGKWN
jgi:hypothetical protein